jgi:hypothetical protein
MLDQVNATPAPHKRLPWNKGKLTGEISIAVPASRGRDVVGKAGGSSRRCTVARSQTPP